MSISFLCICNGGAQAQRTVTMDTVESYQKVKRTYRASNGGQQSTPDPNMRKEPDPFINIFDVAPSEILMFDKQMKFSYHVFDEAIQPYCLVYNSAFGKVVEFH